MNDKEYIEYLESLVFAQEEVLTRIDKMLGNRVDFEKCSKCGNWRPTYEVDENGVCENCINEKRL